jgi:hypothetical protein
MLTNEFILSIVLWVRVRLTEKTVGTGRLSTKNISLETERSYPSTVTLL